jgi:hypothetical protein
MTLNKFFMKHLAKRLGIPEKDVTMEYLEKYFIEHEDELKPLVELSYSHKVSTGGNVASRYLEHIPTSKEYHDKMIQEEKEFISSL